MYDCPAFHLACEHANCLTNSAYGYTDIMGRRDWRARATDITVTSQRLTAAVAELTGLQFVFEALMEHADEVLVHGPYRPEGSRPKKRKKGPTKKPGGRNGPRNEPSPEPIPNLSPRPDGDPGPDTGATLPTEFDALLHHAPALNTFGDGIFGENTGLFNSTGIFNDTGIFDETALFNTEIRAFNNETRIGTPNSKTSRLGPGPFVELSPGPARIKKEPDVIDLTGDTVTFLFEDDDDDDNMAYRVITTNLDTEDVEKTQPRSGNIDSGTQNIGTGVCNVEAGSGNTDTGSAPIETGSKIT
jgi:hypothetical protein